MLQAFKLFINGFLMPYFKQTVASIAGITENKKKIFDFLIGVYAFQLCIINEEVLVALCFISAVFYIYVGVGDSITESLNERSDAIRKDLSTFLILKQENIQELIKNEDSFLKTTENIQIVHNFCRLHLKSLNQGQQSAFNGIVSKDIHTRLTALQNVQQSSQPVIHKLMHDSFRHSVSQELTKARKQKLVTQCFKKLKEFQNLKAQ